MDGPSFTDIASDVGLSVPVESGTSGRKEHILEANTGGAAWFDYDGDGDSDLYYVNGWRFGLDSVAMSAPSARLYRNDGSRFVDVTEGAGVGFRGWGMGCATWDADGDGWVDLFVSAAGSDVFYHNQGDGTFRRRDDTGFGDDGWSTGIGAADFDRDGDVDVYVAQYVDHRSMDGVSGSCTWRGVSGFCGPSGLPGSTDVLQLAGETGRWHDGTDRLRQRPAYYGLGVLAADLDDDGDVDLYVANDSTPNLLYDNDGLGHFTDMAAGAGVAVSRDGRQQAGMGIAVGDVDGDGRLDMAVSNFSHDHVALYARQTDDRWLDVSFVHDLGRHTLPTLGWGMHLVDVDNDADVDLFVANGHVYPAVDDAGVGTTYRQRNQLFLNDAGRLRFVDHQSSPSVDYSSRGSATADFDNDGDLDIFVVNLDAPPSLLRNDTSAAGHWLSVQLTGTRANRSAVGARVEIETDGVTQRRDVLAGTGYLSQDEQRLHFGLGQATQARVHVRWPDGTIVDAGIVEAGSRLRLRQRSIAER